MKRQVNEVTESSVNEDAHELPLTTLLNDLPVAQAELDMVQGGAASPRPVLLVLANRQDF